MAPPNCAVFIFHQTPPETAATMTVNTNKIGRTGRRFADSGASRLSSGFAAVAAATTGSAFETFSAGLLRIGSLSRIAGAVAGVVAEMTLATAGLASMTGTTGAGEAWTGVAWAGTNGTRTAGMETTGAGVTA